MEQFRRQPKPWEPPPTYAIEIKTSSGVETFSVDADLEEQLHCAKLAKKVRGCPVQVVNTRTREVKWPAKARAAAGGQ